MDASGVEKFPLYWLSEPRAKLTQDENCLTSAEKEDIAILE